MMNNPKNKTRRKRPRLRRLNQASMYILACFMTLILILLFFRWTRDSLIFNDDLRPTPFFPSAPHPRFQFMQYPPISSASKVAELRHCNLHTLNWTGYFEWASSIVTDKIPSLKADAHYINVTNWVDVEQEILLQLLELYATQEGKCHFEDFVLDVPNLSDAARIFRNVPSKKHSPRLAIVIVAFQDAAQVQRLVQAIHMPHHYILIHLEQHTPLSFRREMEKICLQYNNVAIASFGTIVYRTDSISWIQLRLIKWFVEMVPSFDYYVALNGASYPLYSANELVNHLQSLRGQRHVWLGELTHGREGSRVRSSQAGPLTKTAKRLTITQGGTKGTFRIKMPHSQSLSQDIAQHMRYKTVSGNQGVYSRHAVQSLLNSSLAMELFRRAAYGCCGILEERTWIAAMYLIGYGEQALHGPGAMWQVWGGQKTTCHSSMKNAVLTRNETLCFKVEDATRGTARNYSTGQALYIRGNQVMDYLNDAKQRGFLFARKFHSDNEESMALLRDIQNELHQ